MSTAVLFPGQGTQHPELGTIIERHRPDLGRALESALGERPYARLSDGTAAVQPVILCASLVGWSAIEASGIEPDVFAGHSLGELTALVAARSIDVERGLELVVARGRLTEAAAHEQRTGGMVAILGGDMEAVSAIASECGVVVANDNSPRQIVLSGPRDRLEHATAAAMAEGFRVRDLDVCGAFHSPAMRSAGVAFGRELDRVEFREPCRPVYSGVTAQPFVDIPRQLAEALTERVRWRELLIALERRGVRTFIDAGPGKVLAGLVKHTLGRVEILTAEDVADSVYAA